MRLASQGTVGKAPRKHLASMAARPQPYKAPNPRASSRLQFDTASAITGFYNKKSSADFIIRCNGKTFHVHKLILSSQDSLFNFLRGNTWQESDENSMTLDEHEPLVLEAVIKFLYGIPYQLPKKCDPAEFHVKVYIAADYYQLPMLKQNACTLFEDTASKGDSKGAESCYNAAKLIYENTPDSDDGRLRDALIDIIEDNKADLFPNREAVRQLQQQVPDLMIDVFMSGSGIQRGA